MSETQPPEIGNKDVTKKPEGLELLREPFPKNQISLLPKPFKKDAPKGKCDICHGFHGLPAAHLEYVGHAALTDRLLDADLNWQWEPLAHTPEGLPLYDKTGGLWIKLTVKGVTRLGYGNAQTSEYKEVGSRDKEVIGDALRNAAMRFGAALDLWHKGDLHAHREAHNPDEEETSSAQGADKYKPPENTRPPAPPQAPPVTRPLPQSKPTSQIHPGVKNFAPRS